MHTKLFQRLVILTVTITVLSVSVYGQKTREEIADKYKWNLTDIYKSDAEWTKAKDALAARISDIEKFKGTLTRTAADLKTYLLLSSELGKEAVRLYSYASFNSDLDTRNMKYGAMKQELQQIFTEFGTKVAFAEPEILANDWSKIDGFIKSDPELAPYRMMLENLFRLKKHSLSEPEERLKALSSLVTGVPDAAYNTFSNAEMPSPVVTLSNGEKIEVTQSVYNRYRASSNRADRELVFKAFWDNWEKYKGTYGEMLYGSVKKDIFYSRARNYESSLEASLYGT
ncbi:MAG: hypothetical protein HZB98_01025 [Bacteroidia bacterium]|nr:hypothetical protein [Bacteroidia bacterium]